MGFADSYVGRLRALIGNRLLITAGVRVAVRAPDGAVLLHLRPDFGKWGLPGGSLEPAEDVFVAAAREVREETGLAAPPLRPFGLACDPRRERATYPNGDQAQFFALCLVGELAVKPDLSTEGVDAAETLALSWASPPWGDDVLPGDRRTLEALATFDAFGDFQVF